MATENINSSSTAPRKKSKLPLVLSLVIIGTVVVLYFFVPSVEQFLKEAWNVLTSDNEEKIYNWVSQFGWFGPFIIVLTMVAQMFLIVIPTPLLMVATILAYGPVWGSLIILFAVFVASSIGYGLGVSLGTPLIDKLLGRKTEKEVETFIDHYGFWAVIATRLSPFLSNDAISFIGGMLKMGYWKFIGATMVGITPLTVLIAFLGEDIDRLKTGLVWVGVGSLVTFLIYVFISKKLNKEEEQGKAQN